MDAPLCRLCAMRHWGADHVWPRSARPAPPPVRPPRAIAPRSRCIAPRSRRPTKHAGTRHADIEARRAEANIEACPPGGTVGGKARAFPVTDPSSAPPVADPACPVAAPPLEPSLPHHPLRNECSKT